MTTEDLHRLMPYAATLGIELIAADATAVRARMAWSSGLCTVGGIVHGGALISLADTCGGLCAALNLPSGASGTATIESKSNLLRAVRAGRVTATSRVLHRGRSTIVVETEVRDDAGRLVAKVTQTQAVLVPR